MQEEVGGWFCTSGSTTAQLPCQAIRSRQIKPQPSYPAKYHGAFTLPQNDFCLPTLPRGKQDGLGRVLSGAPLGRVASGAPLGRVANGAPLGRVASGAPLGKVLEWSEDWMGRLG